MASLTVEGNVNKCKDAEFNSKYIKLIVVILYHNNLVITSYCYCGELKYCKYPLKILCNYNHLHV